MIATGSPVSTNWPMLTEMRSIPAINNMIPATGIEDQELSVAAEGTGVNNPAVTRCCDLSSRPGCQRNALFDATRPVGTAKIANLDAINRQRE